MVLRFFASRAAVLGGACFSCSSICEEESSLFDAIVKRDVTMVRRLVQEGNEELEARNEDGLTPLLLASYVRDGASMIQILIEAGACPDALDGTGKCALHYACLHNNASATRQLLKGGASVSIKENERGMTPVHWAAFLFQKDVLQLLVKNDGAVDVRDYRGLTPLHWVAVSQASEKPDPMSLETSRLLLEHGANAGARDRRGMTPAHVAAYFENLDYLDFLVDDNNADLINQRDNKGLSPLDIAVVRYEMTRYKVRYGFPNFELRITAPKLTSLFSDTRASAFSLKRRPGQ